MGTATIPQDKAMAELKPDIESTQLEKAPTTGASASEELSVEEIVRQRQKQLDEDYSDIDKKKFLRKLDLHLVPWLSVLYLLSFLDRSAIGNARLYGLEEGIGASDADYRLGLTIFFIPYALAEPFTNALLKHSRPSMFLSGVVLAFGIVLCLTGVIQNVSGLYATRFFLGLTEAALFPGVNFFLSCWYKRSEFGLRAAVFFSAAAASGSFGGLLSVGLAQAGGTAGYEAWRWIFIFLGLISVACSLISFWLCHDYPPQAKFLTEREREYAVARLRADDQYSAAGEHFQWKYVAQALSDPKTYIFSLMYAGVDAPLYAFSLTLPTIVQNLGFETAAEANLISVPVYVWACIVTCFVGFMSVRTGYRGFFHLGLASIGVTAYIILILSRNFALSYVAIYIATMGIYPLISNTISWCSNNVEGQQKRAVVLGIVIGFGNLNGIVSSNIYRNEDSPWFTLGHGLILMYICIGICCALLALAYLRLENKKREAGLRKETLGAQAANPKLRVFTGQHEAMLHLGDKYSGFRYRY